MKYVILSIIFITICTGLYAGIVDIGIGASFFQSHDDTAPLSEEHTIYCSRDIFICPSLSYYKMFQKAGIGVKTKLYIDEDFNLYYIASYLCCIFKGKGSRIIIGYGITNYGNVMGENFPGILTSQLYHSITINPGLKLFTMGNSELYVECAWDRTYDLITEESPLLHFEQGLAYLFTSGLSGIYDEIRSGRLSLGFSLTMGS
jgi:hypothetical protein